MKTLTQKQQAITKAITAFVKEAHKQGQQGIISAGLNEAVFSAFNQSKDCLDSQNLESLRYCLNNWHEGNEELLKAFTQANELNERKITSDCGHFKICAGARLNCHLNCSSYRKSKFTYTKQ